MNDVLSKITTIEAELTKAKVSIIDLESAKQSISEEKKRLEDQSAKKAKELELLQTKVTEVDAL